MNEAEWLGGIDPSPMLACLGDRISDRKRYLFACACWRRVVADWPHPRALAIVEMGEKFADGHATQEELVAALNHELTRFEIPIEQVLDVRFSAWAASTLAIFRRSKAPLPTTGTLWQFASQLWAMMTSQFTARPAELEAQAELVRHIIGNPFRRVALPSAWPAAVVPLAEEMYAGVDCGFALHDALLDAGLTSLADHFRQPEHPKGCWLLDQILGKR